MVPALASSNHAGYIKGPSIYDVHTEGGQAQVDACGRPHRKLKLESTDDILMQRSWRLFLPEFRLWTGKKWNFFCDIN